ncbi:hypothetical protein VKT23_002687 [Stygiomarasmius scandens]|uniref:Uncharacterized protein n=1 Tax=Marasmiellus scandens TaxID=2682957 RepID=A0ABR1K2Z7_9AGAR
MKFAAILSALLFGAVSTYAAPASEEARAVADPDEFFTTYYAKAVERAVADPDEWYPEDFPKQYIPHVKYGYWPPKILLGAGLTFDEFMEYATNYFKEKNSYPAAFDKSYWPSVVGRHLRDICGLSQKEPMFLQEVWTRSKTPCVLAICSNYSFGRRFPTEQCEKLLDELRSKGVRADIQWFLVDDWNVSK